MALDFILCPLKCQGYASRTLRLSPNPDQPSCGTNVRFVESLDLLDTITRTQSLRDGFLQELFVASVEKPRLTRKMARATVHLPIGLLGRMGVEHQDQDPVKHRE